MTTDVEPAMTHVDAQPVRTEIQTPVRHFADEAKRRVEKNHSLVDELGNEYAAVAEDGQVTWKVQMSDSAAPNSAVTGQQFTVWTNDVDALNVITVTAVADDVPTSSSTSS